MNFLPRALQVTFVGTVPTRREGLILPALKYGLCTVISFHVVQYEVGVSGAYLCSENTKTLP